MTKKVPETTDKLRIAIDRQGQGNKVDFPDPAAAPLGADDEASGNPPTQEELALEPLEPRGQQPRDWQGIALYVLVAALVFGGLIALALSAANQG